MKTPQWNDLGKGPSLLEIELTTMTKGELSELHEKTERRAELLMKPSADKSDIQKAVAPI